MASKVIYKQGTKQTYLGLSEHLSNTLYFCTDTMELFKGDDLYSDGIRIVSNYDALPSFITAADNILYLCADTGCGYVLNDTRDGWMQVLYGIDNETIEVSDNGLLKIKGVVKTTEQTLTEEEKARARENIGAISADEVPEPKQADWMQNDSTAEDYIKNRTHYKLEDSPYNNGSLVKSDSLPINLLDGYSVGDIILLATPQVPSVFNVQMNRDSFGTTKSSIVPIIIENTYNKDFRYDMTANHQLIYESYAKKIDSTNRVYLLNLRGDDAYNIYFIFDTSKLTEEYEGKFSAVGVYLEYLKIPNYASQYLNIDFRIDYYGKLSELYMPENAESTAHKVTEITSESTDTEYPSAGAVYRAIESAGDGDMLRTLIEADMLCAVTDGDGSILTDENGDILLW